MPPSQSTTETTTITTSELQTKIQESNNNNNNNKILSNKTLITTIIICVLFTNFIYKPLPDEFPQPWKYRLICFGSSLFNVIGKFLEYTGISHRISIVRFAYFLSVGAFNIRDPNDNIEIIDNIVNNVPIRIYKPLNSTFKKDNLPVIFYYHGGGYFLGTADICEPITYLLAKYTQSIVIYVEYRLIPDYKYPAALNDSYSATKTIIKNASLYNIDLNNVVLVGDSAGGNLATVINRKLIEENIIRPKLKVLIYPILQFFDFTLPSYQEFMSHNILGNINAENFKNFIHYFTGYEVDDTIFENGHSSSNDKESLFSKYVDRNLLPKKYKLNNKYFKPIMNQLNTTIDINLKELIFNQDVSPLLVSDSVLENYSALHTYILTVGHDILRDDGLIYAKRLNKLNLNIKHDHLEYYFHGIFGLLHGPLKFDLAHDLMQLVCTHITDIISL